MTLVEFLPRIVPNEDEEVTKLLERSFKKINMKVMTASSVESADTSGEKCFVTIKTPKGTETVESDIVFSAVGVTTNLEGLGLEKEGIRTKKDKIIVDDYYRTSVPGIFAIGDIVPGPALAHVASAEGIICVEKIAGLDVEPLNYKNIPSCIYTNPEIASVGYTEEAAKAAGNEIKVGKFPSPLPAKQTHQEQGMVS